MSAELGHNPVAATETRTESFRKERPQIVGPDAPEQPFPIQFFGDVQRGFGRGGKELGCPTGAYRRAWHAIPWSHHVVANLPDESLPAMSNVTEPGVYYGFAQISASGGQEPIAQEDLAVFPMVMSLGWNPYYKNERMTAVSSVLPSWIDICILISSTGDSRYASVQA
jgi:riboflavin kinase